MQKDRFEIVGVVKDMKYRDLRREFPRTVYFSLTQGGAPPWSGRYFVRTSLGEAEMTRSIGAALERIDGSLRVLEPLTLEEHVSRSILRERMLATLSGFFGGLALILAAVGIYGVMAFQVARRRKEIGIRMALGARRGEVIGLVVGQTARLVLAGSAVGLITAFALTRVTEKLLFGVTPTDPATFAAAVVGLALVALGAAYLPGRAAARLNPVETLRCE
jgi:ABC-type antimicrobial peptide transport system permease subunit